MRGDAGGGAGPHRVRLPGLRDPPGAPARAHASAAAAPAAGSAHPRTGASSRRGVARSRAGPRAGSRARAHAVRWLLRSAECAGGARALRLPGLRRRARRRRRAPPPLLRFPCRPHGLSRGAAPSWRHAHGVFPAPSAGAVTNRKTPSNSFRADTSTMLHSFSSKRGDIQFFQKRLPSSSPTHIGTKGAC